TERERLRGAVFRFLLLRVTRLALPAPIAARQRRSRSDAPLASPSRDSGSHRARSSGSESGLSSVPLADRLDPLLSRALERITDRRKVEHALDEKVDCSLERHARHGDVNQLTRSLADDRAAEQLLGVGAEDELHETLEIADDLSSCVRPEMRASTLEIDVLR